MDIQLPEGGKYMERVPGGDMERTLPTATASIGASSKKLAGCRVLSQLG